MSEQNITTATIVDVPVPYKDKIVLTDRKTILSFGNEAQNELVKLSEQMIEGSKAKDFGPINDSLMNIVLKIRGLDFDQIKPGQKQGFFSKLLGKVTPVAKFMLQYEDVKSQIETIVDDLERHKLSMLKDVAYMDNMYTAVLATFHKLEDFISSGQAVLDEINNVEIPKLKESTDELAALELNDLVNTRNLLERKIHDLKMSRQVQMNALPTVRIIQQNDTDLVEKIDTQINVAIPSWFQKLAMAKAMWNTSAASDAVKAVDDNTNELLVQNAKMLRGINSEVRKNIERGTYDIQAVTTATDELIGMIQDTITISKEAQARRLEEAKTLVETKTKLETVLKSA